MIARDHHYLFSHVHVRNQALRSPLKLLQELSGPLSEGFLFFLWQQVEEVAAEKVSAVGLRVVGVDQIGGGTLALIAMPAPERDTESLFAAVWHGPSGARYFVFDRSAGDPTQATLAELELDDTRINMGRHEATQDALLAALQVELATPRPPSVRPTPPTMAMDASQMSNPGMPSSIPPAPPTPSNPGAPMARPPARKKRFLWPLLGLVLLAPGFCCLATGLMTYEGGLDPEADFSVETEITMDAQDHEGLVLRFDGPEEIWSYEVEGPGVAGGDCRYVSSYSGSRDTCTIPLDALSDPTPSYRVIAYGHGRELFGLDIGAASVRLQQTVEVTRPLGLRFSEAAQTTVVTGFPGRLDVTPDGMLRLTEAPPGTTLMVGAVTSDTPTPIVPIDVAGLTNSVGVTAVFRGGQRISIANVNVRLPDGTTAGGTAQFPSNVLAPALAARLRMLGDAELGDADGNATVWIRDGAFRQLTGTPQRLSDVGRIVLTETVERRSGSCGPYSLYGLGVGHRVGRTRWTATVEVYDRVEGRRVRRRRFRGDRPSCPYTISQGTSQLHGARHEVDAEADAYAREQLAPPTDGV